MPNHSPLVDSDFTSLTIAHPDGRTYALMVSTNDGVGGLAVHPTMHLQEDGSLSPCDRGTWSITRTRDGRTVMSSLLTEESARQCKATLDLLAYWAQDKMDYEEPNLDRWTSTEARRQAWYRENGTIRDRDPGPYIAESHGSPFALLSHHDLLIVDFLRSNQASATCVARKFDPRFDPDAPRDAVFRTIEVLDRLVASYAVTSGFDEEEGAVIFKPDFESICDFFHS
jgi:hypothetical protein